ncbi:hypothetical protein LP420_20225 [Massilia sp. B-10]|nr:hypothetical protein LP420_20225 [Massilia sp. B-10]
MPHPGIALLKPICSAPSAATLANSTWPMKTCCASWPPRWPSRASTTRRR